MAVVYMRKLEEQPESYDTHFTSITKGANLNAHNWILDRIDPKNNVLEIGCGTGILARKIALKGAKIIAIDKNEEMINFAERSEENKDLNISFQVSSFKNLQELATRNDIVVSTFMLSELRPLEQQIFLGVVRNLLNEKGRLLIAGEFVPSGIWKIFFYLRRSYFKRKMKRMRLKKPLTQNWFLNYIEPLGFKINDVKNWNHGAIRALELEKISVPTNQDDFMYFPKQKKFTGIKSQLRILRCLLTGQIDRVPIEPGLYKSGNPNKNSPVVVTSNYEYTYIKLMRHLKGIDSWVLCVDSDGINVWCAARGGDFENKQLIEAVEAINIEQIVDTKTLILPQLSAGGVSIPALNKNSERFPFKVKYGPVWSADLPEYLKILPKNKPKSMKVAKFSIKHRIRAGITHTTFLFRKVFLLPIFITFFLFLILNWSNNLLWIGEFIMSIIISNILISMMFPISNFTRKFIYKGILFGFLNSIVLSFISFNLNQSLIYIFLNSIIHFWLGFFSTMSFSGYTMTTNPKAIQQEYPIFSKLNKVLLICGIILSIVSLIFQF